MKPSSKLKIAIFALGALCLPFAAHAKDTYPKLANYYLDFFTQSDYDQLAKWDFLIIQAEMTAKNPEFFRMYRQRNPQGLLVPYTYPAMFYEERDVANYVHVPLRKYILDNIDSHNWWLRGGNGEKLYMWPQLAAVNVTNQQWQDFNVAYLRDKMGLSYWDGIMYDTVDSEISHYSQNRNGIDITGDGRVDSPATVNRLWQQGMAQLFAKTRAMLGPNKLLFINGNSLDIYQPGTNGRLFENFPTPWEGNGSWQASMYQYLKRLPSLNKEPYVYVVNSNTNNTGNRNDYRNMRFGLTSTLLGDGYFSFDHGTESHQQLWWYDEYDVKLGRADTSYFNLLALNDDYVRAGLWRRDFENGISIVNSTAQEQLYVFKREQFEKLRGTQDRLVNDGTTVNYIRLKPNDGIIMRKVKQDVVGDTFTNGHLIRSFDLNGKQTRNSFFAFKADVDANLNIFLGDLDGNGSIDRIAERSGKLVVSGPGRKTLTIAPFGPAFKGRLSFAAADFNRDGQKEIVVAPGSGGGPHVKIFSNTGASLSPGFMAFDKNFRGGVTISAGDANNDGRPEILVAPIKGLPPTVKLFSDSGRLVGSFMAYDKKFLGGVGTAVGDVDRDGKNEIITGPVAGGPHVRVFDSSFRLKAQFMAFDPSGRTGVRVMVGDSNGDGKAEILAGTSNF